MKRDKLLFRLFAGALAAGLSGGSAAAAASSDGVEGAWQMVEYRLASGEVHPLAGTILFVAGRWQVAFFVLDSQGRPQRASAEGGTYSVRGNELMFRHELNFSFGAALAGLPESEPRMTLRDAADAAAEPVRLHLLDDRMTIDFPSGNRIDFVRLRGPK